MFLPRILAVVTSLTHLNTGTSPNYEQCKVLICDTDSIIWVSRHVVAFYPFKVRAIGDTNFTEIFSTREGVHNTQAFQHALALANTFWDTSTPTSERDDALKLLQMGFSGHQKLLKDQNDLVALSQFCGGICVHSRQRAKCKDCFPGLPQEDLQRGLGIGLMEPCWMRPPNTPENFAHLCLIVLTKRTNQSANCFFQESWLLSRV